MLIAKSYLWWEVVKAVRLADACCFWALPLFLYHKQQTIRAVLCEVMEAALLQVILVPCAQNERAVCSTGSFLTMCMDLLSSKQSLPWRFCQLQVGYCKPLVCWPTPYSCDKTYFLDHLLNIKEIYLCGCGIGPPPHLRCKYCCHQLQWFRAVAGPCSASHWPAWQCHQLTPWKYDSPAISPIWPKDALFLPMSPHARYQDTHKMIRKTTSTP